MAADQGLIGGLADKRLRPQYLMEGMLANHFDRDHPTAVARIWDPPIILFHWALVALIAFSWWSGEDRRMEWHYWSGYAILTLLLFRLFWGIVGSRTARFANFVAGPRAVAHYARSLSSRQSSSANGHNPLGGWSVLAMIATLLLMVLVGLFAIDIDGLESGPLAYLVSFDQARAAADVHALMFNIILGLTALHVGAVFFYLLWKRHNLIAPMLHGHAPLQDDTRRLEWSAGKAIVALGLAAAITYAVSQGLEFGLSS